jgi:hypothetical protein
MAWDLVRNLLLIAACAAWLLMGLPAVALAPGAWFLLLGAAVIAFLLSTKLHRIAPSGCPKRRGTVPESLRILPAIRSAGVGLWIVPADSRHETSRR